MKPRSEMTEGPEAATRFENAMRKIIAVPRSEMVRREAEYQKQASLKPKPQGDNSEQIWRERLQPLSQGV